MLVCERAGVLRDCVMTGELELDWDWSELDDLASSGTDAGLDKTWSEGRMYAISFDLICSACERFYPGNDWRAYKDIQSVLNAHGFWNQQGSVYFSKHKSISKVFAVVMALREQLPWFKNVVRDFRVLRIEEHDDLRPLLGEPDLFLGTQPPSRQPRPGEFDLN